MAIRSINPPAVEVLGLKDITRAFRKADDLAPKMVTAENRAIARWFLPRVQARARSQGGVLGHVHKRGYKAVARQNLAGIKLDDSRHPEILGAEFGGGKYGAGNPKSISYGPGRRGRTGLNGYTSQFRQHRGNQGDAGYALYPQLRDDGAQIEERYGEVTDRLLRQLDLAD